ncbi:M12 family metallo-peptidase [Verrucomicrobiaceae bacterium 227]
MTHPQFCRSSSQSGWRKALLGSILVIPGFGTLSAQVTGVPELSSRPGAAYTVYLNVAGFDYEGNWAGTPNAPGFTPAVNRTAATSTGAFTSDEQTQIKAMWARLAQSYTGFDINVTTIDPAPAGLTDAERQAYYDATPNMLHTIVGSQERDAYVDNTLNAEGQPTNPTGKWYSTGADGVAQLGVAAGDAPTGSGFHTNWMFSEAQAGTANGGVINGDYIGAVAAHENGHSFGLRHQGDFTGANTTPANEYTNGDTYAGDGSYVAIMGNASGRQRVVWRDGTVHNSVYNESTNSFDEVQQQQNDVQTILSTNSVAGAATDEYGDPTGRTGAVDLHFVDDGIGHTAATASDLGVNPDGTVNYVTSSGIIVPSSEANPQAMGSENYTSDFFKFQTDGTTTITLTLNNSTQYLEAGVADGVGTFRGLLQIFGEDGLTLLYEGTESDDTLTNTFSSTGVFNAGTFLAKISSNGGRAEDSLDGPAPGQSYNPANYFEMGGFFLTGSGFVAVPEPSGAMLVLLSGILFFRRKR